MRSHCRSELPLEETGRFGGYPHWRVYWLGFLVFGWLVHGRGMGRLGDDALLDEVSWFLIHSGISDVACLVRLVVLLFIARDHCLSFVVSLRYDVLSDPLCSSIAHDDTYDALC